MANNAKIKHRFFLTFSLPVIHRQTPTSSSAASLSSFSFTKDRKKWALTHALEWIRKKREKKKTKRTNKMKPFSFWIEMEQPTDRQTYRQNEHEQKHFKKSSLPLYQKKLKVSCNNTIKEYQRNYTKRKQVWEINEKYTGSLYHRTSNIVSSTDCQY